MSRSLLRGQLLCHIWGDARWEAHEWLSDCEVLQEVLRAPLDTTAPDCLSE